MNFPRESDYEDEKESESPRPPRRVKLVTLFRDSHLHAIQKPAGLATVSERWNPDAVPVIDALWREWQAEDPDALRPHLVHRLDRGTTGVLLFACHRDAQRHVRQQFQQRTVQKSYLALTFGCPQPERGTIEIAIDEHPRKPGLMQVVSRGGKACVTHFEVIEKFREYSWVRLRPETGRTHQIRISLQSIGHPCAIDPQYGGEQALYASSWIRRYKLGRGRAERPVIDRVTLHAEQLTIEHPESGDPLTIEAPLPKDLEVVLKHMRKHLSLPDSGS